MEYTGDLTYMEVWNIFDEWGLAFSLPRIHQEEVTTYKARLLDNILHRAGAQHRGLFYGINRDLGLTVYHNALIIKSAKKADGLPILGDLMVEVRSDGIAFTSDAFKVIREAEIVPSDTLRVRLTLKAVRSDMVVEYPLGTVVSKDKYTFDWERNEIVFNDQDMAGLTITISYLYYQIVPTHNRTLTQVAAGINALLTPGGDSVATCTVNSSVVGTTSANGVPLTPPISIDAYHTDPTGDYYGEFRLPCGEASLRALGDPNFIKTEMGSGDTYFDTRLIRWVEQAKNITKFGWENFVFDESRFEDGLGLAVVPTLADPKTTSWRPRNPLHLDNYSTLEADNADYTSTGDLPLKRVGFAAIEMQSGVGGPDDLKIVVEESDQHLEFTPTTFDFFSAPTGDATLTGDSLAAANEGF